MSDQIIEIDEDGKVTLHMADCCRAAILAEREACARIACGLYEVNCERDGYAMGLKIANRIRARTAQEEGATSTAESESADPPTAS